MVSSHNLVFHTVLLLSPFTLHKIAVVSLGTQSSHFGGSSVSEEVRQLFQHSRAWEPKSSQTSHVCQCIPRFLVSPCKVKAAILACQCFSLELLSWSCFVHQLTELLQLEPLLDFTLLSLKNPTWASFLARNNHDSHWVDQAIRVS